VASIRKTIRKVLARPSAHTLSDQEIAERVLEMGDEYDWRDAALELLPDAVWAIRRAETRKLEKEARERAKRRNAEQRSEAESHGFASWDDYQEHVAQERETQRLNGVAQQEGFESWKAMQAAREAETQERCREIDAEFQRKLSALMAPFMAAMEFTEAFLNSEFALGDGRRVTWGDATSEDHVSRINLMRKRIEGIEGDIELHESVLGILSDLGVSTLREAREREPQQVSR